MAKLPLISVVDDDESIRESLPDLLREFGYDVRAFASAEEFLDSGYIDDTGCLILDIAMPGMTGPELQEELKLQGRRTPIIFVTAHADDATRPRLMNNGAVECLSKPFSEKALINALNDAFKMN